MLYNPGNWCNWCKAFLKANELVYDATVSPCLLVVMGFTRTTEDCIGYIGHAGYHNDWFVQHCDDH